MKGTTSETGAGGVFTLVGFDPFQEFVLATALRDRGHTVCGHSVGWGPVGDSVYELGVTRPDAVVLGPALGAPAPVEGAQRPTGEGVDTGALLRALWAAPETRHLPVVVVDAGEAAPAGEALPPNVRARLAPPFDTETLLGVLESLRAPQGAPAAPPSRGIPPPAPPRPRPPSADRWLAPDMAVLVAA